MEFGNLLNYLKVIDPLAANGCIRLKGTLKERFEKFKARLVAKGFT